MTALLATSLVSYRWAMLQVQLLGPLQVLDRANVELTPPGGREQLCLATLALVAPQALSTERLAVELYRDREATDPRNAVQAVISRLRRVLGRSAGGIETTGTGYRLVDVTLDLDSAEQLLEAAMSETDATAAQQLLDDGRSMWRGPTLEGLAGDLVDAERLRIDGLRADSEEAVAQERLDSDVDHRLLDSLQTAVIEHPLRERRWEQLMLALYRDGRQAEALRAFQRARSHLSDQLGLEPGPALVQLERRILEHDPQLHLAPTPPSMPAVVGGPAEQPVDTAALPSGTLTVVLCDVEGSVRRWERDPVDTAADIAQLHDTWSDVTTRTGGRVVKSTGDGVLSIFETAAAAVEASVAALVRHEQTSLSVRVALYSGSLHPVDGDYRGPVVNRCARLLELADGGQILTTGVTAELARTVLTPEISLRDLGIHWLRDVSEPVSIVQVNGPGLRSAFSPLDSQGPARLPRLRGTLLGRDDLVDEVVGRVGDDPVVSLIGPGGIGKTSVALAAAWKLVETRPVTFVDLARVTDPDSVTDRIVDELALPDHDDDRDSRERLADRLRVGTDLVVVDNAEHLLDSLATLLDHVLTFELKGSFLITSRQPLGLPDEAIIAVPPLPLPGNEDDLDLTGRSPSVQLFMERVRAMQPDTEITPGLLPVVAHICRRLDGIPLAIELAAGRASFLTVDDIAARLDDQLRLLRQLQSTRERRHRSLEAVVGWSADQLSPSARELFGRLSVMAGSFNATGAERLMQHVRPGNIDALDDLDELVGASLLVSDHATGRLRMLEPIRQFAAAELADRDAEVETRRAQVAWLTELLVDAHGRRDPSRGPALNAIDPEADQLAAVLVWIADANAIDLIADLALPSAWWFLTRDNRAGERLLGQLVPLVDREQEPMAWANAVVALAVTTAAHPISDVADAVLEAVDIFDEHNHPEAGLARVAAAFAQTGGLDPALPTQLLAEAERLISSDDRWATAVLDMASMTLHGLLMNTDPSTDAANLAISTGERAASTFRAHGEQWALGITLSELGRIHKVLGDFESAERHFLEGLDLLADGKFHGRHYVFTDLGRMAASRGDHERAADYHRQAREIAEADGNPGCLAMALAGDAHAAEARNDVEAAVNLYQEALGLMERSSIIEKGAQEWQTALDRLTGHRPPG